MRSHSPAAAIWNRARVSVKTLSARKAVENHLIVIHFRRKNRKPFSGFCHAKNRLCYQFKISWRKKIHENVPKLISKDTEFGGPT